MAEQNETNQQPDQVDAKEITEAQKEMKAELSSAGVPSDVPVSEMSVEHQVAYWKARARANEKEADAARNELREQAERKPVEPPQAPPSPKDDPAMREVFEARLEAALATRPEFKDVPFAKHLDMSTFVGDDGRVDREAVAAFFEALPQGAHKTAGTPAGWGSNAPYEGASGIDAGREMFKASRAKN